MYDYGFIWAYRALCFLMNFFMERLSSGLRGDKPPYLTLIEFGRHPLSEQCVLLVHVYGQIGGANTLNVERRTSAPNCQYT